jgi:hypothetical protein
MSRTYYRETIWARWWYWVVTVVAIALPLSILVAQSFFEMPAWWHPAPSSILAILTLTMCLVFLNFVRLTIKVDSERIEVRYGIAKKTIPCDEVLSCGLTKGSVYLGVGIRLGVDGSLAFTTSFGDAIRINRKSGRPFVVSTNNPEKLSEFINKSCKARSL